MRSTSAKRSARTSSIKGARAFSLSQAVASGKGGYGRQIIRHGGGTQVAEDIRLTEARGIVVGHLHGEQTLMDDLAETIHDSCTVKVQPRRSFVRQ